MKNAFFILFFIVFFGCSKENLEVITRPLQSSTNVRINKLYFVNAQVGFAVGGTQWEKGEILKTTNGGETWQSVTGLENFQLQTLYDIDFFNAQTGQVVGLGGKILRTDDAGNTWDLLQESGWEYLQSIALLSEHKNIIVAGDGSFGGKTMYSTEAQWWNLSKDSTNISLRSVAMASNTKGFAVGYGGAIKTTDGGTTWQPTELRGDYFKEIYFVNSQVGYICGFQGSVLKTTDSGETWQNMHKKNGAFFRGTKLESLHFFDENIGMVCGLNGKLLFTENGGENWKQVDLNTSENLRTVFLTQPNTALVAGDNGKIWEVKW